MGIATGYFRMLRVQDWIFGYFFIPIIGAVAAAGVTPLLFPVAVVSFCMLAFGFVINNVADVEIDRVHTVKCKKQKNPLVSQTVSLRGTWILLILLALAPLCLSLVLSVPAFSASPPRSSCSQPIRSGHSVSKSDMSLTL